jgi:hypothetical protein
MRPSRFALLLLALCTASMAEESPLLRCRKIIDPGRRLSCYDAIGEQPLPTPAAKPKDADFGLSTGKLPDGKVDAIETTLAREIDGWESNTRFNLSNGQVWKVTDDSSGVLRAGTHKVTVRRGALGSFFLEFEGTHRSPRVERVQ